jgi:hypothetical protein
VEVTKYIIPFLVVFVKCSNTRCVCDEQGLTQVEVRVDEVWFVLVEKEIRSGQTQNVFDVISNNDYSGRLELAVCHISNTRCV